MEYYSTNYDEILEEERKNLEGVRTTQQDAINKTYDENRKNTQNTYNSAVNNTEIKYESDYERNAVQKLINEKMIAERNANLGLTDSGLNRMQQTAVQMSYANQKGALDIAKQGALDELSQDLALSLSNIEQKRVTALADLDANIETQAQSNAIDRYNANVKANAEMWKAQQEAAIASSYAGGGRGNNSDDIMLWYYTGTYDEDGNPIFRNSEGKAQSFGEGVNPYTGTVNKDIDNGVFRNGYQPNNIGGKKLYAQEEYEVYVNGNKQKVWSYDDGKTLWAWDGSINEYVDVTSRKDELEK